MPTARWDLMCDVTSLSYDFDKRTGRLNMAPAGSCSMSGLTAIFIAIDPNVERIVTFAGDLPDSMYKRGPDGWESTLTR
jgi:hypothetical protein